MKNKIIWFVTGVVVTLLVVAGIGSLKLNIVGDSSHTSKLSSGESGSVDVTEDVLPKIQGYWVYADIPEDGFDVSFLRIDGKKYIESLYHSDILATGEIKDISKSEEGTFKMNLHGQVGSFEETGAPEEFDALYSILSVDDFKDNLVLIAENGWTSGWKYMGATEEEFHKRMKELIGY